MSQYFFNSSNGRDVYDEDGTELPDDQTAKLEAIKLAGVMLLDNAAGILDAGGLSIDVADADGTAVFSMSVRAPSDR